MDEHQVSEYCDSLPGAERDHPFGVGIDCWMLNGKCFAMMAPGSGALSLKSPARHMGSIHGSAMRVGKGPFLPHDGWVGVEIAGHDEDGLKRLIGESYELVRSELPQDARDRISAVD